MTKFRPSEWLEKVDHEHGFAFWKFLLEFQSVSAVGLATLAEFYSLRRYRVEHVDAIGVER